MFSNSGSVLLPHQQAILCGFRSSCWRIRLRRVQLFGNSALRAVWISVFKFRTALFELFGHGQPQYRSVVCLNAGHHTSPAKPLFINLFFRLTIAVFPPSGLAFYYKLVRDFNKKIARPLPLKGTGVKNVQACTIWKENDDSAGNSIALCPALHRASTATWFPLTKIFGGNRF